MNQLSKILVHSCLQLRQLWFCLALMLAGAGMAMAQTPKAIWTAGNTTLTFINSATQYVAGDEFNGQAVTAVWSGTDVTENGGWWNQVSTLTNVVFDSSFQDVSPTSCDGWFEGCSKLTNIEGLEYFDTSNVTDMTLMFFGCSSLTSLDLSNFNTMKVTNMSGMFAGCTGLTSLDVSYLNTSNVTNMSSMFADCPLQSLDLSKFDTSKVTDMSSMFNNCGSLTSLDLSSFDTSNVSSMSSMFDGCSALTTIISDGTWTATNSSDMFAGCTSLVGGAGTAYDASHIDATYARMDDAFTPGYFTATLPYIPQAIWTAGNTTLTFISSTTTYAEGDSFNGQSVTKVWSGDDVLNQENGDVPWYNIVSSSSINFVFDPSFASARPLSISNWFFASGRQITISGIEYLNTSQVTDMSCAFMGCSLSTDLDLSHFDTSNVTNMASMFEGFRGTSIDLSSFDTRNVTDMSYMFAWTNLRTLDLSNFDTSNVTDMECMLCYCDYLLSLDVSNFDTSNVTDMNSMFSYCRNITSLDLSNFDTSKVTNMSGMFQYCGSLTTLDLSNFDTSKVTNMSGMFQYCGSLTTLDLSNFNTSKVTNMSYMFQDCSNLTTIVCGNSWTPNSSNDMFSACISLVGGNGTAYDASKTNRTYARPDAAGNPGYFTAAVIPQAIWTAGNSTLSFVASATQYAANDSFNGQTVTAVWSGTDVTASGSTPAWNATVAATLTNVVFDSSFSLVHPGSLASWFENCASLTTTTGAEYLNTLAVTDMSRMFYGCSSLTTIYCDADWNTATVTTSTDMFTGCTSLVGGKGTSYDALHVDVAYANLDKAGSPGYFTGVPVAQAIWTQGNNTFTFIYGSPIAVGETFNGQTVTAVWSRIEATSSDPVDGPYWAPIWSNVSPSNVTTVVFDPSFAVVRPTSLTSWFGSLSSKLTTITGIEYLNTSKVTNMRWMFDSCRELTSLDLSHFDTSNVTDMSGMFFNCGQTSLDLSNFDTSNVTDMNGMFEECTELTTLDLSNFDTSKLEDATCMFLDCELLTTIYCDNDWNTGALTSSENMFSGCTRLVGGVGTTYDASHVGAGYAHPDGGIDNPGYFTSFTSLPQAIWTAGNNTLTFICGSPIAVGETFNGQTVTDVFGGKEITATDPVGCPLWYSIVREALTNVVFDSSFESVLPRSLSYWFASCSKLTSITGIEYLNTSNATHMQCMFLDCNKLTSLDLSHFDTHNVINMSDMFSGCSGLTSLDLSNFDTSNVEIMCFMFYNCSSLTSLDLSNFDNRNVTDYECMFYGCSSLTTIYCNDDWNTGIIEWDLSMFGGCTSLVGGAGTAYDESNVDVTYAHPDEGTTNPGYFTSSTEVITANKPGDKETYWATYYYSGSNTVALPAAEQSVTIYTARYSEKEGEKTLVLTEVTDGVIKAGQGVIIESSLPNVTMKHSLTRTATDDFFAKNELKGRDHACALPTDEGTIYTMGNVGGQLGFYKYIGSQLKARRAYLAIPAGSEAGIRIRFDGEDTATGIDTSTKDKVQSTGIYDLQGRRVVNPTKGIYIVNGKKVYMK